MFLRESERRSKGMWIYSVKRITDGAWMESFWEWSMWPLCSSTRATPLKIMTTARLSVHALMCSKEVFRTKTLPFISAILRERGRGCQNMLPGHPEIYVNSDLEQVRKRGLPPLLGERGQATLPDLFIP